MQPESSNVETGQARMTRLDRIGQKTYLKLGLEEKLAIDILDYPL
jgi:hypothetical protein